MHLPVKIPHLGLRVFKTALAVVLSLYAAELFHSALPIFAAIGAISAMTRTFGDMLTAGMTQFFGTLAGSAIGLVAVVMLPHSSNPLVIGLSLIAVILLCLRADVKNAIPLSCIVMISICLNTSSDPYWYALHRFTDTMLGVLIALAVNMFIKPYDNHTRIRNMLVHYACALPDYINERVLLGHYPSLDRLYQDMKKLSEELNIYENQSFPHNAKREQEAVYLRGCQQLTMRMLHELCALCAMTELGRPSQHSLERISALGLTIPPDLVTCGDNGNKVDTVMQYHLDNLLDTYQYLLDMLPSLDSQNKTQKKP